MGDKAIVAFEHDRLGSAYDELEAMGLDFAADVLCFLQDVYTRKNDHRKFRPFAVYKGVEMFEAKLGDRVVVFSVEINPMNDLKITIMFAGQHGVAVRVGALTWDGNNYAALRTGIVQARASVWFN